MFDVIIIGAGPAGLTASIYLARSGKKSLVLEAKSYGGQIINTLDIENYPGLNHVSGFDLATNMYNQAKELGATIKFEKVVNIKNTNKEKIVITREGNEYKSKAIILATGSEKRKLNLDNEEKLTGRGISYCATCDGAFYKKKIVMVNGGGNTAIEDALYLSNIASKVYVVHRRDTFRADMKTINLLKEKDNVEFIYNSVITKINGNEKLESVEITDKDNNKKVINIDGLFIAIGAIPENENFKNVVNLDNSGYIITNEDCHTSTSGIFAAGDTRGKELRQLVTATNDGAIAANEAIKYINNLE